MTLPELMRQKNMSMYKLSKNSQVPYTTLNDIVSGKTRLQKCSAETVYRLSRELGVSMEALLELKNRNPDALNDLKSRGYSVLSSQLDGTPFFERENVASSFVLIVGNEGNGVSLPVRESRSPRRS